MTNICKIDNQALLALGIQYTQATWTLSEVKDHYEGNESEDLGTLINLCSALQMSDEDTVLSTYTNKTKEIAFSCPRIHLNSEGKICLFLASDTILPLSFNASTKTYITESGVSFKVDAYRNEQKEIKKVSLVTTLKVLIDDFEEEWACYLPVLTLREADLKGIASALQKGDEVPENSLVQIGAGGSYSVAYKPYMLANGYYKIVGMYEPFLLPDGGKIWKGTLSPVSNEGILDESITYDVRMNSGPFIRKKSETLVKAALTGKAVYVYLDGGFNTTMGVAAIGNCSILPEVDGVVSKTVWDMFKKASIQFCLGVRRMNTKALLKPDQIQTLTEEYFANSGKSPVETKESEPMTNKKETKPELIPF